MCVYKADTSCIRFLIKASILGGAGTISKENLINEEIRDKEVRVIDSDGSMLGVMPIEQALGLANEKKLDLVNISPNAKPAVCKILDYGKYRYELARLAASQSEQSSPDQALPPSPASSPHWPA